MAPLADSAPLAMKGSGLDIMEAVVEVLVGTASTLTTSPSQVADAITVFDATHTPAVGIQDYARRLHRYLYCTEECFVISLVLLERILESNRGLAITHLNVHRCFLASSTLAAKFQDDDFYSNPFYAHVGGVTQDEMLNLEAEFLRMLDWRAHVSNEDYEHCLKRLGEGNLRLHEVPKAPAPPKEIEAPPSPHPARAKQNVPSRRGSKTYPENSLFFCMYPVCSSHTYLMLHMKVTEGAKNLVLPSGPYLAGDQG